MANASLAGLPFRVNPSQVSWDYKVDASVIPTVGGRVVQVFGVTMGDMTIQGLFGQERRGRNRESWQLAEQFQQDIALIVNRQSALPSMAQLSGADSTLMNPPSRFVLIDDQHNWDFTVYVKSLRDVASPDATVEHVTGKFSYGYTLTLHVVQDNTGVLTEVAKNAFIDRLSNGLGWKRTGYNGSLSVKELEDYLLKNSPDGTIHGLVLQQYQNASAGVVPTIPGTSTPASPSTGGTGASGSTGGASGSTGGAQSPPTAARPTTPTGPSVPN